MKKFYTFLLIALAMLLPTAVSADSVSQDEALAKAVQFFSKGAQTRSVAQFELVWNGEPAETRSAEVPTFYVFNRTDAPGFVIIAGDETASPVIGYSFENGFGKGEMPANLRWWLEGVRSMIREARSQGADIHPNQQIRAAETVKHIETATWDQGAPYNLECPYLPGGQQTITGCVATATAIFCKHHRWPTSMSGTTRTYVTRTHQITVAPRTLGSYNYDLMPDSYASYTAEQAAEVSRLMADIGALIQADYGVGSQGDGGTGAFTEDLVVAMQTTMKFSKSLQLLYRGVRPSAEWIAMLKEEINTNGPLIYGGSGSAGGHQFICDGYDTNDNFHFNWGWSGSGNGFYSVDVMVPAGTPYSFAQHQDAIFGAVPDPDGTTQYNEQLITATTTSSYAGMAASTNTFAVGAPFTITIPVFNYGDPTKPYTGRIAVAHFDSEGVQKGMISSESVASIPYQSGMLFTLPSTIKERIRRGDFMATIFWNNVKGRWERIYSIDGAPDNIQLMAPAPSTEVLAASTSIDFDKATRVLTIAGYDEATCRITTEAGVEILSDIFAGKPFTVDCSKFSGRYKVEIGFEDVTPYSFTLVF